MIAPNSDDTTNQLQGWRAVHYRPWRLVTIVATMIMELSWLTLWYVLLFQSKADISYWKAFVVLGVMYFSSYLLTLWMDSVHIKLLVRRIVLVVMILVFLLIGLKTLLYAKQTVGLIDLLNMPVRTFREMYNLLPPEFVLMLLVLWVAWRGVSRVGKLVSSEEVMGEFKIGLLMFLGYGLFSSLARWTSGVEIYLFLFAGLFAMSSARISVISYLRGGQRIPFDKRWVAGMTLIILTMVGISAFLMHIAGGEGGDILATVVTWIIYGLALLFSPLMFLFLQFLFWLGRLINISVMIQGLIDLVNRLQVMINALTMNIQKMLEGFQLPPVLAGLLDSLALSKPIILWGVILLFVTIILMIARRQVFREQAESEAEYEQLAEQEGFLDQLRKSLRRRLGKMADSLDQALRLRSARQVLAAARIRRIYAHLMNLSQKLNQPRPLSRTPLEFLPDLEALLPGMKGELGLITEAYLKVRYGDLPEVSEDVDAVEQAWQRVSELGDEKVKETKNKK
jgi:hypothetical protein